jgi:hypothetical protein
MYPSQESAPNNQQPKDAVDCEKEHPVMHLLASARAGVGTYQ